MSDITSNPPALPDRITSQAALWGLILGILSFFLWLLASIPGLILSTIGIIKTSKPELKLGGKGLAISGLITSLIGTFIVGPLFLGMLASKASDKAFEDLHMSQIKQLHLACRIYSMDNEGSFPPNLGALEPHYVIDLEKLGYRETSSSDPGAISARPEVR